MDIVLIVNLARRKRVGVTGAKGIRSRLLAHYAVKWFDEALCRNYDLVGFLSDNVMASIRRI